MLPSGQPCLLVFSRDFPLTSCPSRQRSGWDNAPPQRPLRGMHRLQSNVPKTASKKSNKWKSKWKWKSPKSSCIWRFSGLNGSTFALPPGLFAYGSKVSGANRTAELYRSSSVTKKSDSWWRRCTCSNGGPVNGTSPPRSRYFLPGDGSLHPPVSTYPCPAATVPGCPATGLFYGVSLAS